MGMNDQNEPPKRHVRMKRGRPRKAEITPVRIDTNPITSEQERAVAISAMEGVIRVTTEKPQVNSVIQVIKGEHTGRLAIVGRIDPDCYKCYVVLFGGTRDYLDVRADEFALIGKAKKAFKDAIPEHPLPSGTPNINSDTTPFGGFK